MDEKWQKVREIFDAALRCPPAERASFVARACGAEGYTVDGQDEFEDAFAAALASGKPTLIDARITRLALPHYSTNPEGVLAGIFERVRERIGV